MPLVVLLFLCVLAGCERRPELALCREADRCEQSALLVDEEVCAEQVRHALTFEGPECQRCVTGLRCEAIERVLSGKSTLRSVCGGCSEHVEIPVAEGAPTMLVTPAIAYRPPELAAAPAVNDELQAQAEAVCAQGEDCEGVVQLVKPEECVLQVSSALASREPECRRCAGSLSCAGAQAVVLGTQKLSRLCPRCGEALDSRADKAPGPDGPYLIIAGLVAAPTAAVEGAAEAPPAAQEPATKASDATKPEPAPSVPAAPVVAPSAPMPVAKGGSSTSKEAPLTTASSH